MSVVDHDEWLRLTKEEAIDPDLPICDAHHHLWDGPGDRGRYLVEEFLRDASSGHRIVETVSVECGNMYRTDGPESMKPVGETEFAESLASRSPYGQSGGPDVAAVLVPFVDLTLGLDAAPVLEAHIVAGKGRVRGVRQSCTWDRDPSIISLSKGEGMMRDSKFREGFALLAKYSLTFDAWQYYTQLLELADLARAYPDTTIIVNHAGGPLGIGRHAGRSREVLQEWKRGMSQLASCPNALVKLGGLGMPRCGFGWHEQAKPPNSAELAEAMKPYLHFCVQVFGVERCMFESNFPVDGVSYPYTVLWNAFKRLCEGASAAERAALFRGTAVSAYRLGARVMSAERISK
jgi:L-fuconolactonase